MLKTDTTGVFAQDHPWMQTHLGIRFQPTHPRIEDIEIEDIAHALSLQCRYAGHTNDFYSVAQHCVLISQICPPSAALWGLMHDSPEAYLQDMIRPLKMVEDLGQAYLTHENVLLETIAERFGLTLPIPPVVKMADNVLLFTEQRDLMDEQLYWCDSEKFVRLPDTIRGWDWQYAKRQFLDRFHFLTDYQFPEYVKKN